MPRMKPGLEEPPSPIQEKNLLPLSWLFAYWSLGTRYWAGVRAKSVPPMEKTTFSVGSLVKERRPEVWSVVPPVALEKAVKASVGM